MCSKGTNKGTQLIIVLKAVCFWIVTGKENWHRCSAKKNKIENNQQRSRTKLYINIFIICPLVHYLQWLAWVRAIRITYLIQLTPRSLDQMADILQTTISSTFS